MITCTVDKQRAEEAFRTAERCSFCKKSGDQVKVLLRLPERADEKIEILPGVILTSTPLICDGCVEDFSKSIKEIMAIKAGE